MTLQATDRDDITVKFLMELASDKKKLECLKALGECPKFVEWIQRQKVCYPNSFRTLMTITKVTLPVP